MAFGMPSGGGSSTINPFVKYNAKAGRMIRVDRTQSMGGWSSEEVDITDNFQAVIDLENIEVGWVYYSPNGPQRAMAVYKKQPTPQRPSDTDDQNKPLYKQGFTVLMALAKGSGGGLREFGSAAGCVVEAMGALYDAYEVAPEARAGQLPVVKLAGVKAEKGNYGTNYRPNFEIVKWVDRPEALPTKTLGTPAAAPVLRQPEPVTAGGPPATGSTPKAPPAQSAPPAAPEVDDDFG